MAVQSMPEQVCIVCGVATRFLYTEYNDIKIRPPRCLGCVMKFPPPGMNLIIQAREFKRERRWMAPYKHHQWAIIQQDKIGEDWLCLLCKKTLSSPGLGMPGTVDCAKHGTERTLKSVFWVNIKLVPEPRCPICRKRVELVTDKVAYKYKLGKNYFPFICEHCP